MKTYRITIECETEYFFDIVLSHEEYLVVDLFVRMANEFRVAYGSSFKIEEVEVDKPTSTKEIEDNWYKQRITKGIQTKSAEVSKLIQEGMKAVFENAIKKSGE